MRVWILVLLCSAALWSAALSVDPGRSAINVGPHLWVFYDDAELASAEAVLSGAYDAHFEPSPKAIAGSGRVSDATVWLRLELINRSDQPQKRRLVFRGPPYDEMRIYRVQSGEPVATYEVGMQAPLEERPLPHRYPVIPLSLEAQESQTFYLSVRSSGPLFFPASIETTEAFMHTETIEVATLGLYFGILVAMIIYNLILYLSIRDRVYLFYALFMGSLTLLLFQFSAGLGQNIPLLAQALGAGFHLWFEKLVLILALLFALYGLQARDHLPTGAYRALWGVVGFHGAMLLLFLLYPSAALEMLYIVAGIVTTAALLLALGLYLSWRGVRLAVYFSAAWIAFAVGVAVTELTYLGWLPLSIYTKYGIIGGAVVMAVALSLGLADRIRALRQEALAKEKALIQQAKMAEIGQLFGMLAHQWKQPLNAVSLTAQCIQMDMQEGLLDSESCQKSTDRILEQVQFMAQTVQDFQNFIKPSRMAEGFLLCETIAKIQVLIKDRFIKQGVQVVWAEPCDPSIRASGHANEFGQVVLNLFNNAIEAIEARKAAGDQAPGVITLQLTQESDRLQLLFCDNGTGITPQQQKHLFELFATTKGEKGTGLGLYMVRLILARMGGEVRFVPSDEGSCFELTLLRDRTQTERVVQ